MTSTSFISSLSLWNAPRSGAARLQAEAAKATREIADGRYADVGLALGRGVARSLSLRQGSAALAALQDGNGVAALRLGASQAALQQMQKTVDASLRNLTGLPDAQRAAAAAGTAGSELAALVDALNASTAGQYVLSGTNTRAPPIRAGAAAQGTAAVAAAFQAAFRVAPGDPSAAAVTADDMQAFLDGPVAGLFSEAGWAAGWSQASSRNIESRISLGETLETSANANAAPFRRAAMAYAIAAGLGLGRLSAAAQSVATGRVMSLLSQASSGLTGLQADLGRAQARITDANGRMDAQAALLSGEITRLEAVDPAEAKVRVDRLTTQMQMSYALTAQLRQLSLVQFL
ncbi:hypothetical protein OPKNFCMD_5612 [Methylobacterium crusticola]|uniref:Flagellin n=1 Tax=Methylobacterium crusticola TaxID=1697972 RepID=A0ABQ4R570_9HYPH|nr:flagellar hook-associated family protein [Methylobacterium crusticola]GJD52845.1 hypothetical protein OPKNFCMD_5612 [Methylobacterium crusticola]